MADKTALPFPLVVSQKGQVFYSPRISLRMMAVAVMGSELENISLSDPFVYQVAVICRKLVLQRRPRTILGGTLPGVQR